MQSGQGQKKRIIEIGHGQKPIFRMLKKLPLHDQSYIGLDINSPCWPNDESPLYDLEEGRRKIMSRAATGRDCSFIVVGRDGRLPLADNSANEAYMSLVLSDPRLWHKTAERLLAESRRILMPGGHLVIYNGTMISVGYGDVLIRYPERTSVFKIADSNDIRKEDLGNPSTALLNRSFSPLPESEYEAFLRSRGYSRGFPTGPGTLFSIFEAV